MPLGALLDLPTVIFTTILIEVFFSVMMLLYGKRHETYPGYMIWGLQLSFLAVGQVFSLLRGFIPDFISIFVANFFNISGILLTYEAASRICSGRPIDRRWYLLIPVMIAGQLYYYLAVDSIAMRTLILSAATIPVILRISLEFLNAPDPKERWYLWLLSADYFVLGLLLAVRAVDYLMNPVGRKALDGTLPNNLLFFYYLLSAIGATVIVIILYYRRLADELNESHRELQQLATRYDLAISTAGAGVWEYDLSQVKRDLEHQIPLICDLESLNVMDGGSVHLKGSIIPEDLVQINQTVAGIAHENEKIGLEYRVRMENGEIRYRYCNARSFLAGDSHDLHLVGLNTDITPLRTAQNALHEAMKKLSIMTSITRHDIMNAVAVIEMGTEILLDEATDEEMRLVIADIGQAGRKINTLIRFTSQYQELGQHEPVWVDIVTILSQPWVRDLIGNRSLTLPKPGTLIYGDRMIEKVLYNLLENSIRHGGVVHSLSFSYRFQDNDLLILYTDDGQGIASHEKDLIFNRDYGKNTGMGLFLIQEILAITGLTVIEDGQPGSGARFVIRVGPGLFKA